MIRIIAVGKLKEKYYADAFNEYLKRISAYIRVSAVELQDEKCEEGLFPAGIKAVLKKEGDRILKTLKDREYVISLEIAGGQMCSEKFAERIENLLASGHSDIVFIIGGSLGLSDEVIKRADCHLSFSDMTFPHQLMRVILAEQIYRAFKIMRGEPYHK